MSLDLKVCCVNNFNVPPIAVEKQYNSIEYYNLLYLFQYPCTVGYCCCSMWFRGRGRTSFHQMTLSDLHYLPTMLHWRPAILWQAAQV